MNATRRNADPATGRAGSDAAVRGALLIAVAVIIGLLLLWRGHDDDSTATVSTDGDTPVVTSPDGTPATNPDGTPGTEGAGTDTTAPPPPSTHAPSEVVVLVANGTGTSGGAGAVTQKLVPLAYNWRPAADASSSDIAQSVVYFREGFQEDARQVAIHLGVPEDAAASILQPMPAEPPVRGTKGMESAQAAHVLVLLGTDQVIPQG